MRVTAKFTSRLTSTENQANRYNFRATKYRNNNIAQNKINQQSKRLQTKPAFSRPLGKPKMFKPVIGSASGNNTFLGGIRTSHRQQPPRQHQQPQQYQQQTLNQQYPQQYLQPNMLQHQQQHQTRFHSQTTSPIKINNGFQRMQQPHQPFGGFQRQSSQPHSSMGRRMNAPSHNLNVPIGHSSNFNRSTINKNSFLSFSESGKNSGLQSSQSHTQPANRYKAHIRPTPSKNKSKLLAAPYNTTQYIMHDYSKRKTSGGENMLREQFEHDWGMQMQSSGGEMDISEQFEQPKRDSNSSGETTSQSESDLESLPHGQQSLFDHHNNQLIDTTEASSVNRLSSSI